VRPRWNSTELRARTALAVVILVAGFAIGNEVIPRGARPAATVRDAAGLLDLEHGAAIEAQHRLLLADHDVDYHVETVAGMDDLDAHAAKRFAELGVGEGSRAGRGLLLVIDAKSDQVRLEVGRSLEGSFPDAFVAYVEQRQLVPFFRAGRVADGVLATTELLVSRIQGVRTRLEWSEDAGPAGSAGGGARTAAQIGRGDDGAFRSGAAVAAADTPEATVRAYLDAMRARNGNADLDLYTPTTRAFLRGRVLTPAQMDLVSRTYRACHAEPARVSGNRAVIRYAPQERVCAPFFLLREDRSWRLDLETASRAIRFGRSNAWRLERGVPSPYSFGFEGWRFDAHGFPIDPETNA
jgi:uncharacterized protein